MTFPRMYFICSFLVIVNPCIASVTFDLTNIDPQNEKQIVTEGEAAYNSTHGIQLTQPTLFSFLHGSKGRATYIRPLHLWDKKSGELASFSTNFTFIIHSNYTHHNIKGLTFVLRENSSVMNEMGLPIDLPSMLPMSRFVAVEFDTWMDPWDPQTSHHTYVGDHVGIGISSLVSVKYKKWLSDVPNRREGQASIIYDSVTKNLSVSFTGFQKNTTVQEDGLVYTVDLREELPEWVTFGFTGEAGSFYEQHTVTSWSFNSSDLKNKGKNRKVRVIFGVSIMISFLATIVFLKWMCKKKKREEHKFNVEISIDFEIGIAPRRYSYHKLARSTSNFAESKKLGEGGFGDVYIGYFKDSNTYAAVKKLSRSSRQGIKEYASEIMIISRLRHRNLVQLVGWCHENRELLLVYEYMENGSLDLHLFKQKSLLTWDIRYKIAQGLGSALLYLHEEWEQCVLHRDIKSSNVMLDSNLNPKLGDFGLAKLVEHEKGSKTTLLAGTMGYMAPECLVTGKASKESDVFSFGVVALEISTGRRNFVYNIDEKQIRLVEWVWELYGTGTIVGATDPCLGVDFVEEEVKRLMIVGLWCAHPDPSHRPSMGQVIQVLKGAASPPELPIEMPVATYTARPTSLYSGVTSIIQNQLLKLSEVQAEF